MTFTILFLQSWQQHGQMNKLFGIIKHKNGGRFYSVRTEDRGGWLTVAQLKKRSGLDFSRSSLSWNLQFVLWENNPSINQQNIRL